MGSLRRVMDTHPGRGRRRTLPYPRVNRSIPHASQARPVGTCRPPCRGSSALASRSLTGTGAGSNGVVGRPASPTATDRGVDPPPPEPANVADRHRAGCPPANVNARIDDVQSTIRNLRADVQADIQDLRADIRELREIVINPPATTT